MRHKWIVAVLVAIGTYAADRTQLITDDQLWLLWLLVCLLAIWALLAWEPVDSRIGRYVPRLKFYFDQTETQAMVASAMAAPTVSDEVVVDLLDWRDGNVSDPRPDYKYWTHAVFRIKASKPQRGRAFIDVHDGQTVNRTNAHIAGENWHDHEIHQLRPGEQYRVPTFLRLHHQNPLWIDGKHRRRTEPLPAGCYITDAAFLNALHRAPLGKGVYRLAVILVFGENDEHRTAWRQFEVT